MKNRKINFKRLILFIFFPLLIICILCYFFVFNDSTMPANGFTNAFINYKASDYDIIHLTENPAYSGIGQQHVGGMDGYTTTFTLKGNDKITFKEYKQNGNASWSQNKYWDNTMETDGCGITALSIILSGYGYLDTPEDLRKEYYPILKSDDIPMVLKNSYNIECSGFYYDGIHLSDEKINEALNNRCVILACVWNKSYANRWTTESHYMAILATDNNGKLYISNPNGIDGSEKASGWYDTSEITKYLAKVLYIWY